MPSYQDLSVKAGESVAPVHTSHTHTPTSTSNNTLPSSNESTSFSTVTSNHGERLITSKSSNSISDNQGSPNMNSVFTSSVIYDLSYKASFLNSMYHNNKHRSFSVGGGVPNSPNDEIRQMLDSIKDSSKLEAMKKIVTMMAEGSDTPPTFFADVVKNVVSKNIEIKKLVYLYLTRYAEEQQDLALLSISSFQRSLKDANQLIRASAMRVLSSIRVQMIAPIVMMSIHDASVDMSPFVRKTAAHAIPKLFQLDSNTKDELIDVIERLLGDRTTLVIGSAVMAYEEVCPERVDLLHRNYRKLCTLLVDIEEWGQISVINLLTRYCRSQFLDPNLIKNKDCMKMKDGSDEDYQLLMRSVKPLLQSHNSGVVLSVVQLLYHCGQYNNSPSADSQNDENIAFQHKKDADVLSCIVKPMLRLIHSPHTDIQCCALHCLAHMTSQSSQQQSGSSNERHDSITSQVISYFEPHLKHFFIHNFVSECRKIKVLKIKILTNLVSKTSISVVLKELQVYVRTSDFVVGRESINGIGRCAIRIESAAEVCIQGLLQLVSPTASHTVHESIVSQCVIVLKQLLLLQLNALPSSSDVSFDNNDVSNGESASETPSSVGFKYASVLTRLSSLILSAPDMTKSPVGPPTHRSSTSLLKSPEAKADVLWLVGQFSEHVPLIGPDLLRHVAKTFTSERDCVKLQAITLAAKLYMTHLISDASNGEQFTVKPTDDESEKKKITISLLIDYVLNLAKFDMSYDIRDRARLLRALLDMVPWSQEDRNFPKEKVVQKILLCKKMSPTAFSCKGGASGGHEFQLGTLSHLLNKRVSGYRDLPKFTDTPSHGSLRSQGETDTNELTVESVVKNVVSNGRKKLTKNENKRFFNSSSSDSSSEEDENEAGTSDTSSSSSQSSSSNDSDSSVDSDTSSSSEETLTGDAKLEKKSKSVDNLKNNSSSNFDLLSNLIDNNPTKCEGDNGNNAKSSTEDLAQSWMPSLSKLVTGSLQVEYRFIRCDNIESVVGVQLRLTNHDKINSIHSVELCRKKEGKCGKVAIFPSLLPSIRDMEADSVSYFDITLDFNDSMHDAILDLFINSISYEICIQPKAGELIKPLQLTIEEFNKHSNRLRGMNEIKSELKNETSINQLDKVVKRVSNLSPNLNRMNKGDGISACFAGQSVKEKHVVLVAVEADESGSCGVIVVKCENMVLASMLSRDLIKSLQTA